MDPLELKTLEIIKRDALVPVGCKAVLGVSGGSDSVGLLLVLSRLREILNFIPVAVYVDHGLRPAETGNEKTYVAELARELDIDFECRTFDTTLHGKQKRISLEHAARELRYQAFSEVAGKYGADVIVTAHTADDQAEEVLIRLLRGSGRKGIAGMQTKYKNIVRPFLETDKKDILTYLAARNVQFLEDSSNQDRRFLRNRIRHELIPFLEERFEPGIKKSLRKAAQNLAEDEKLLEELMRTACASVLVRLEPESEGVPEKLLVDRKKFVQQPGAIQRRIIEHLLWHFGSKAHYTHIMQVVKGAASGRPGSEIHLSRGLRIGVQKDYLEFVYPEGKCAWRGRLYEK